MSIFKRLVVSSMLSLGLVAIANVDAHAACTIQKMMVCRDGDCQDENVVVCS